MMGQSRTGQFKPIDAIERNKFLRAEILKIAQKTGTEFWDTTEYLKEIASNQLLHGPRDPIHFNRAGYEAFSEAISSFLKPPSWSSEYQHTITTVPLHLSAKMGSLQPLRKSGSPESSTTPVSPFMRSTIASKKRT